jgi:hypothetical protein
MKKIKITKLKKELVKLYGEKYANEGDAESILNVDELLDALDDERNDSILKHTPEEINETKYKLFKSLNLTEEHINDLLNRLNDYRFIENIDELVEGNYIRWINLNELPDFKLKMGAKLLSIKTKDGDNDNNLLSCVKFLGSIASYFNIKFESNLIFQKLSEQELMLLYVINSIKE